MTASTDSDLTDLYRELILDHARSPRNYGRPENATHTATGINPLCGDKLQLYLTISPDNHLVETAFEGSGCAISMASASLMTEIVRNLTVTAAERCFETVTKRLTADKAIDTDPEFDLSKLRALDGVRQYPSRVKCATLAWHSLHQALQASPATASTE